MKNLQQQVTDQILAAVDAAGEWKPCWIGAGGMPKNGVSGRRYNGINILVLWCASAARGYGSHKWATYQQWQSVGGQVRKGERSTTAVLYKTQPKKDNPDESYRLARAFNLFNADQIDGLEVEPQTKLDAWMKHDNADVLIADTRAVIIDGKSQPCYVPALDEIWMPPIATFFNAEGYYATAFHELAHWTGAKSRLDRTLDTKFKTRAYAMEELVAELASSFVMAELGMTSRLKDEAAAYIKHWRDAMKEDNTAIFTAASAAAKAADFILGFRECEQQEAA